MKESLFVSGTTPPHRVSTPQQPNTAARMLTADNHSRLTSPVPPLQKPVNTVMPLPPPLTYVSTSPSHQSTGAAEQHTPKRTECATTPAAAATAARKRSAAVPSLHAESLTLSSINSSSPSPLSEWSNRTEKHRGPATAAAASESPVRRGSTDTTDSAADPPQQPTELLTVQPPAASPSSTAACGDTSPIAERSSAYATQCTNDTLQPDHGSAYRPTSHSSVCRSARVSLNLDSAFLATQAEERVGNDSSDVGAPPLPCTPAYVPETLEERRNGPDLSPCTVSSTSAGGSLSPAFHRRSRGTVWLCDVSREEEDEEDSEDSTPVRTQRQQQRRRRCSAVGSTSTARQDTDCDSSSDLRSKPLRPASSSGSVHRSLFPHATEAYVSAHPSGAPVSSASRSTSLSPVHARVSLTDHDFSAQYALFQPPTYSPQQCTLHEPPAQATPSHTELLTDVFADGVAAAASPAAALPGFGASTRVAALENEEEDGAGLLSVQTSPDTQPLPSASPHRSRTVEGPLLFHSASSARLHHTYGQLPHGSPFSGEADMATQVFRSGTHVLSPLQQRHSIPSEHLHLIRESSPMNYRLPHAHLCSPPVSPQRGENAASLCHHLHHNLLDDTLSSLHSRADTSGGHSSLHTPRNVSAVAGGSESASVASSPLLTSFAASCGGPSLSLASAAVAAAPTSMADLVRRADTPTSPHTPLDRRTPGPSGMQGSSYASLSEYSHAFSQHHTHRPQLSQPMTPQKSARRTYSRQTTPSQSFRSKVQSHSFESQQLSQLAMQQQQQQQPHAQFFSGLWTARGQVNTSTSSCVLGETTMTTTVIAAAGAAAAERDYLAPSRNPFSPYRSLEIYADPLAQLNTYPADRLKASADEESGAAAPAVLHRAGQQPLTQQQGCFVRELTTAVLRPDAAVVLYEQIIPAPARAPGSHRARQRAPSPAQAALDLLLQPRPSLSHSLSLSGGGASGRGWGGTGAAGAAAQVNRDEGLLTQEAKGSLTTPPPAHTHSLVHTTAPHTEGQRHAVSSPSSTTASPAQRPQVALAKCSPRHAPAGSPPRTPGRTTRPPDTTGGTRTAPALAEPRTDAVALPASTFTTPLSNEAKGEKDGIGSSASFSSVAARNLSSAFSSPEEVAQHPSRPLFSSGKSSLSKMVVDNSTNNNNNHMEEEEDEEDASPPPRRPTTQFDARNPDTSLSPDGTPLYAERQLHFNPNAEEEEENAETSVQALASSCVMRASLGGVDHESSMATESSSTGSPDFLRSTVANVNPLSEQLSSSVRLHQSLHSALRSGAEEDARSAAAAAQQPQPAPLPSLLTRPGERMQEGWRSPEPPRPQLGQQQQQQRQEQSQQQHFTPTQEPPGLRLSVESNRAPTVVATNTAAVAVAGHLFSGERICLSSNEAGSTTLSPSAYQALGSVLDALDTTVTSDEEIAGDRFQAHHEFQFLHYVDTALDAAVGGTFDATVSSSSVTPPSVSRDGGRPVPLSVEVNGVTWLATHRLSGLPYAVKEVPAVAFNTAELQCLTLSNSRSHSSLRSNALGASSEQRLSLQDLLEAEDYLARYHGVSTPPQDSSKPTVHLLQLEYFPRGSLYDVVRQHNADSSSAAVALPPSLPDAATQLSVPALLTCDFWEAVVQQGLRGLRVLHRAGLLHGSPLPSSLFFAGHTQAQRWVKWAGFGSARSGADIYPTESLPHWLSEAVGLLYKQREAAAAVPAAAVIDVAVFCLSVLELIVDHVEVRDRAQGLLLAARPPTHPAAADALCRLEWMEVMVRRLDGRHKRHGAESGDDAEEVALQRFMQFLWNTANSYHTAEQVLAEMCVRIDPALHTVTALYQYEIDRLARQLRERERRAVEGRRRHEASCSSSLQSSHHERNGSVLSTTSAEATRFLSPHEEGSARASHWGGSGRCPRPRTSGVAVGHGLTNAISGPAPFPSTFLDEQRAAGAQRLSPHFFPRRAPTSAARVPRATFLDVSAEHDVPSCATAGEGICLFLPTTTAAATAAATKLSSPATVPVLSLAAHRPASEGSAWCPTTARRGRADVHPRVRAAAHAMLLNALSPLSDGESMTLQHVWKALLRPAVHSLQLRGWMSMYAGIPLPVTGVGRQDGNGGEEAALEALLTSLRPMTSFE